MKKLIFVFVVVGLIAACTGMNKEETPADESAVENTQELITFKYEIDGLQDSIISDSIWRIIFQVEGIDKLVLSREEQVAVFTVDTSLLSDSQLREEITRRGGVLVE